MTKKKENMSKKPIGTIGLPFAAVEILTSKSPTEKAVEQAALKLDIYVHTEQPNANVVNTGEPLAAAAEIAKLQATMPSTNIEYPIDDMPNVKDSSDVERFKKLRDHLHYCQTQLGIRLIKKRILKNEINYWTTQVENTKKATKQLKTYLKNAQEALK